MLENNKYSNMNKSLKIISLGIWLTIILFLLCAGFLYHPKKNIRLNVDSLFYVIIFSHGKYSICNIDCTSKNINLNDNFFAHPYDSVRIEANARLKIFDLDSILLEDDEIDKFILDYSRNKKNGQNEFEISLPFKEIYSEKSFRDTHLEPRLSDEEDDLELPSVRLFGSDPIKSSILFNNPISISKRKNYIAVTETNFTKNEYGVNQLGFKQPLTNKSYRLCEANLFYIISSHYDVKHGKDLINSANRMLIVLEPNHRFNNHTTFTPKTNSQIRWVTKVELSEGKFSTGQLLISSNSRGKSFQFTNKFFGSKNTSIEIGGPISDIELEVSKGFLRLGKEDIPLKENDNLQIKGDLLIYWVSDFNDTKRGNYVLKGVSKNIRINSERLIPCYWLNKPLEIKLLFIGVIISMMAWIVKTMVSIFYHKNNTMLSNKANSADAKSRAAD